MTIDTTTYAEEIASWREEIDATIRRDWVSLAGRFELQAGLKPHRHRHG